MKEQGYRMGTQMLKSQPLRIIQRALLAGAAASALVLGTGAAAQAVPVNEVTATAGSSEAASYSARLSAWGNPNMCTHSVSLGVGWAGTKTVTYLSGYSKYEGSRLYHYHRIYIEWIPISGHPYDGTYTQICNVH
jgi:hypothetical protein